MTSSRSYRPALSPLRAIDELVGGAGVQFDGDVVRAFLRALRSQAIDVRQVELAARTAPAQEQHVSEDPDGELVTVDPEFRRAEEVVDPTAEDQDDGLTLAA
jgi:HD-GYP domain-containing protein (c-di-GMP phosphodiesterase class II)